MLPNYSKLASLFLREHASRPLLIEESQLSASETPKQAAITSRAMAGGVDAGAPSTIAIVHVYGILTEDEPWYGTTYSRIRERVQAAVDDPSVAGILLCIDSPGGSTDHAFETAGMVADAAKQKPIWAVANVNCYSAAYLLASSASRIYAAPTSGGVGSIGVYGAHVEYSEWLKKEGIAVTLISAGKGKTDGNPYEPLTKAAKEEIQIEVDRLYAAFVSAVAARRKITADQIVSMGAALKHGADAVSSMLADKIGTFDEAIAAFMAHLVAKQTSAQASAGANSNLGDFMEDETQAGARAAAEEAAEAKVEAKAKQSAAAEDPDDDKEEEEEEETSATANFADAEEISQLCSIAGIAAKTSDMLALRKGGKSMSEVRAAIIDAKAAKGGEEIRSNPMPGTGTAAKYDPASGPLVKAMRALGGEGKVA